MSKRASAYKHGQPGREFEEERPEEPMDEPKRATAAQLAARKIKTLKGPRRPAGVSSGLSAFNPNPPSANAFNFGPDPNASNPFAQSAPAPQSSSGGFSFGQQQQQDTSSGGAFSFGNNSTSSFPPAQASPNPFANSTTASFPPAASGFGSNNNNTNGSMSPFSAKPDLNFGNTSTAFGASTPSSGFTFGAPQSQPPTFGASQNNAPNTPAPAPFTFGATPNKESSTPAGGVFGNIGSNASTSASSGGLFNTASTPQTNAFAFGQNNNAAPSSTPASNLFGNLNNNSTTSSTPFQFGASTAAPAAQESASTPKALFGGISASVQAASASETPKPLFGSITNGTSQAPATPFGSNTATTGGTSSLFGTSTSTPFTFGAPSGGADSSSVSTQAKADATPAPAAAPATPAPATPTFKFGNTATPAASTNLFAGLSATTQATQPPSTSTPAPTSFGGFGQSSQAQLPNAAPAFGSGLFASQTPEAAPTATPISKSLQSVPATAPAKKRGIFDNDKSEIESTSAEASKNEQATEAAAPAAGTPAQAEKPAQNPFAAFQQPATKAPSSGLFQASKPAAAAPASTAPAFTPAPISAPAPVSASASASAPAPAPIKDTPVPSVPRVTVPPNWTASTADSTNVLELVQELTALNEAYRAKLTQLPATADWSSLSKFHSQKSAELKKKIDDLKKKAAAAKGVTGEESVLSTKRKNDELAQSESSFKKARGGEPPSTPNSKTSALPSTTPKTAPPAKSFNLFAASTSTQETTPALNLFASTSTQPTASAAAKPSSFTAEQKTTESAGAGGFKPNFGSSAAPASTGFTPSFKPSSEASSSSGSGFFGQFGGKTKADLRKERLKKAINEEWDSDEDDEDFIPKSEFIARWNREEDERQAKLDAAASSANLNFKFDPSATAKKDTPAFTFTPASSNVPSASQSVASGTSTPGFLNSRVGSPAPSTEGARSVFDTPFGAQTPSDNLFGHLSAASSQREDDSDDEADGETAAKSSAGGESKQRKSIETGDAGSESSETLEESMRRKKPATKTPSLANRMTRDNSEAAPDTADKDDTLSMFSGPNAKLFNINGSQTPAPKKAFQFDFDGAAKSAPPKQNAFAPKTDTFAGDQTFKFGSPIKFGASTGASTPFAFTPAASTTATPAETSATTAKPAGNPFAFLNTATSAATSAVSSRAATPATDAEASGTDAAAINEDEAQNFVAEDKSLLSEAERSEFDVLFEHPEANVTKLVKKEGEAPKWASFANGRLWVLKSREDESVIVRLRMKTGAVKLNNRIVPSIKSSVAGKNKSQVRTVAPFVKDDGSTGFEDLIVAFKAGTGPEKQALASKFSEVYNDNV